MTERQWDKLKKDDYVMNKRGRGIVLRIVEKKDRGIVVQDRTGGKWTIPWIRYQEFQQWFPQERLPL